MSEASIDESQTTAPNAEPSVEDRARRMGWKPKEEFAQASDRWVDAEEFIKKGEDILPVLRDRLRNQDSILAKSERRMAEMQQVLKEMHETTKRANERAYKQGREDFERQRKEAISEGNVQAVEHIESKIKVLEEDHKPKITEKTEQQEIQPEVQDFVKKNQWFNTDLEMNQFAINLDKTISQSRPYLSLRDRLIEVSKRTKLAFSDRLQPNNEQNSEPENAEQNSESVYGENIGNTRRRAAPPVSSPTPKPNQRHNPHSFANLPPDAKAAFVRCKRYVPDMTEEEYANNYMWDN